MKNVVPIRPVSEEPPKALPLTNYKPAASHSDASVFRERMEAYARKYGAKPPLVGGSEH